MVTNGHMEVWKDDGWMDEGGRGCLRYRHVKVLFNENDRQRKCERRRCVCQVPCEEYIYAIPSMLIDLICCCCCCCSSSEDKNDDDRGVVRAQTLRVLTTTSIKIDEVHMYVYITFVLLLLE